MNNDVMIGTRAWGSDFLKWDTAAVYGMGRCERLTEEARRTGIRRQGSWEPQ